MLTMLSGEPTIEITSTSKPASIMTLIRKNFRSGAITTDKHIWKVVEQKTLGIVWNTVKSGTLLLVNTISNIRQKSNAKRLSGNSPTRVTIVGLTDLDMRVDVLRNGIVGSVI